MGRPDILFPLFAGLETLAGVGPKTAKALPAIGIERPRDLLFTLPHTVVDRRRRDSLREVAPGEVATVEVTVLRHQPPIRKGLPYRVIVEDADRLAHGLSCFDREEESSSQHRQGVAPPSADPQDRAFCAPASSPLPFCAWQFPLAGTLAHG